MPKMTIVALAAVVAGLEDNVAHALQQQEKTNKWIKGQREKAKKEKKKAKAKKSSVPVKNNKSVAAERAPRNRRQGKSPFSPQCTMLNLKRWHWAMKAARYELLQEGRGRWELGHIGTQGGMWRARCYKTLGQLRDDVYEPSFFITEAAKHKSKIALEILEGLKLISTRRAIKSAATPQDDDKGGHVHDDDNGGTCMTTTTKAAKRKSSRSGASSSSATSSTSSSSSSSSSEDD